MIVIIYFLKAAEKNSLFFFIITLLALKYLYSILKLYISIELREKKKEEIVSFFSVNSKRDIQLLRCVGIV